MTKLKYYELEKKSEQLLNDNKYDEFIELFEKAAIEYPDYIGQINLNLALVYSREKNDLSNTIRILKDSLSRGIWYPKVYFSKIVECKELEEIFENWAQMAEAENKALEPELLIQLPNNFEKDKKYPLFIALYGWGENIEMFKEYWKSQRLSNEYILAIPQSSQKVGSFQYSWTDMSITNRELVNMYEKIKSEYNLDYENIIIGGFSQGATVCIEKALDNKDIPAKGFIALNPDMPKALNKDIIEYANQKGIKGYIITGDKDGSYEEQKEMMKIFGNLGFSCKISVTKDWGHWFPEDLSQRIDEALEFIV